MPISRKVPVTTQCSHTRESEPFLFCLIILYLKLYLQPFVCTAVSAYPKSERSRKRG